MKRDSGVLLHITSLPEGEGIGDLGSAAHAFVDWLVAANQDWWQMLPCGEVGYGDSPYQSMSAYAGNPLLISLSELVDMGLLDRGSLEPRWINGCAVDFDSVRALKAKALRRVCERFRQFAERGLVAEFDAFVAGDEQHWLQDYARFMVLKKKFNGAPWNEWPQDYARYDVERLKRFDLQEARELEAVKIVQFLFARQWRALREYANSEGVRFLGDCPIYVAADSADVWSNAEFFDLHSDGTPRVVAGVPPDYFSATGQLWGNPLYRWDRVAEDNFSWWRSRLRHCAKQFDLTRIDHFRGLEAFWEVPADAPDASYGHWCDGPGAAFLDSLRKDCEALPLVAEDLGDLTPAVHELRARYGLPGMRVLQFGFDGGHDNPHAPERITPDVICYAGTHDNNTTRGWIEELAQEPLNLLKQRYGLEDADALVDALLLEALGSPAQLAVLTMQDLLKLPSHARFNTPGTVGNNWSWRVETSQLSTTLAQKLAASCTATGRGSRAAAGSCPRAHSPL